MKILCNYTSAGPAYVRNGWRKIFEALGHTFRFWQPDQESAFDVFGDFSPDVYVGTTYEVDRAVAKCIAKRPQMKVALFASAWGPYLKNIDLKQYPIVVTSEEEKRTIERLKKETGKPDFVFIHAHDQWLDGTMSGWNEIGVDYKGVLNAFDVYAYYGGVYRPELACDYFFCGSRWPYKARNLDPYLLPLCHPSSGLSGKIFGAAGWELVPQWLGSCSDDDQRDLFKSATVCPNISEPHSTDKSWDVVERPYKILGAGSFCISDYVEEAAKSIFANGEMIFTKTPKEFFDAVKHFVAKPDDRKVYMEKGQRTVLEKHTYHHRVADMLGWLGFENDKTACYKLLQELLSETS